jgi:hypothetical protein
MKVCFYKNRINLEMKKFSSKKNTAVGVTKYYTHDEIEAFDGTFFLLILVKMPAQVVFGKSKPAEVGTISVIAL